MIVPDPILYALYVMETSYWVPVSFFAHLPVTISAVPDDDRQCCEAEYHAHDSCFREPGPHIENQLEDPQLQTVDLLK